jgi:hypothetical protein
MINEELLQYVWKTKLFNQLNLVTIGGDNIEIIKQGELNTHAGPDFSNAKIKIGNHTWAGNIELHVKSSDWFLHQHEKDAAYQNIILHVVYEHDREVISSIGIDVPTLVLKPHIADSLIQNYQTIKNSKNWIPCENELKRVPSFIINSTLEKHLIARLERKSLQIRDSLILNKKNWEETFYEQLAKNFGFNLNAVPFELLAKNTPIKILAKHKTNKLQLEALLFGQAGFLNKQHTDSYARDLQNEYSFLKNKYQLTGIDLHLWKFLRLRPVNFPSVRLSQFAALIYHSSHLFSKILETTNLKSLQKLFDVSASDYWDTHYVFDSPSGNTKKKLGISAINTIIINTIVPFLFEYGKQHIDEAKCELALKLLEELKPEKNSIINHWIAGGINPSNALQTQGLLQLKNEHCDRKLCLNCAIGHYLLKNT